MNWAEDRSDSGSRFMHLFIPDPFTLCSEAEETHSSLPKLASKKFGPAAGKVFDVRRALAVRTAIGAPSPKNVAAQIKRWEKLLK